MLNESPTLEYGYLGRVRSHMDAHEIPAHRLAPAFPPAAPAALGCRRRAARLAITGKVVVPGLQVWSRGDC